MIEITDTKRTISRRLINKKLIQKALKNLLNNSWILLLKKQTGKQVDDHISINPRKIYEIIEFLKSAR